MDAALTWKRLRALVPEFGSPTAVLQALGDPQRQFRFSKEKVTRKTAWRVWRLYQQYLGEGKD